MKHTFKKLIALVLSLCITFSFAFSVCANDDKEEKEIVTYSLGEKALWNILQVAVDAVVNGVGALFPVPPQWRDSSHCANGFMSGTDVFLEDEAKGAKWLLGYDSRSILLDRDDIIGKMYVGGTIGLEDKFATDIADDLKVRTVALSDNSGRGIAVFCAVDCYGISLSDVRTMRMMLQDYCIKSGINSLTFTSLHQHSAVDTFGMNGNIWKMVFTNPAKNLVGAKIENGKNAQYMANLFEKCVESIEAGVENMEAGKLYYGTAPAEKYINDKRQPYVMDNDFTRLRFVPESGKKETWIVTSAVHCVGNGAAGTVITGDYPYYMEKELSESNLMVILGAEQSTTPERDETTIPDYDSNMSRLELTAKFGKAVAEDIRKIETETEVAPILNIRYTEVLLPVENPILLLAGKAGLFENIIRKTGLTFSALTETGYIELGKDLAFAVIPGEIAPEIVYGGCLTKETSWSGEDWQYPSLQKTVNENRGERKLLVLGLANDQIGYIVPDNNYMPMIHSDSQSIEFVSLGKNTASKLVSAFGAMVAGIE